MPGNYYCRTSAIARTLINCPFTAAFILKVEYANGLGYPRQVISIYTTGQTVTRMWDADANQWTEDIFTITNNDLQKGIPIHTVNQTTLKTELVKISTNYAGIISFYNSTDSPFSFVSGVAIAINTTILVGNKKFILIGCDYEGTKIEVKHYSID